VSCWRSQVAGSLPAAPGAAAPAHGTMSICSSNTTPGGGHGSLRGRLDNTSGPHVGKPTAAGSHHTTQHTAHRNTCCRSPYLLPDIINLNTKLVEKC